MHIIWHLRIELDPVQGGNYNFEFNKSREIRIFKGSFGDQLTIGSIAISGKTSATFIPEVKICTGTS